MGVPGSNLLLEALDMIESQPVTYFQNTGRTLNAAGVYAGVFLPGVTTSVGSVQAVDRKKYEVLGLDLEKQYVHWFVPAYVFGVERDLSGDQFDYAGEKYQIESTTDWFAQDGWTMALAVKIGAADA